MNLTSLSDLGNALFAVILPFVGPWLVHLGRALLRHLARVLEDNRADHQRFSDNMLEVSQSLREFAQAIHELKIQNMRHELTLAQHENRLDNHDRLLSANERVLQ